MDAPPPPPPPGGGNGPPPVGGSGSAAATTALLIAAGAGQKTVSGNSGDVFEPALSFQGYRKGMCFKLGDQGLGYYTDHYQTLVATVRPQLPESWRSCKLREELLKVDPACGAGLALTHSDYGFAVEKVAEQPGQNLEVGDVVVAVEGRLFVGISGPQMQASFQKRRVDGARLTVASLEEVRYLATRDPNVTECWDATNQTYYYFNKKTGKSSWVREEVEEAAAASSSSAANVSAAPASGPAPVDLANFLSHGFNAPKEQQAKKKRKAKDEGPKKDESDLAREEKGRWDEWNSGERGGYTEMFLRKYKNCTSYPVKPKEDKRLKGSVGPGQGNEYMARWTGSKNSFN
eukprot:TRINITY_DN73057_c0_g1_i1.p1 TRINITY_DN73057_c0_g1~~TRINITY_DN73057_c0_g1_i1.p1  ORF type:complete len:347 (-),score=76.22 TRINITY_DN73057_c0_g1_i1:51-1091(-)